MSKKRPFCESESEDLIPMKAPPIKKQKLNHNSMHTFPIKSKLFANKSDQYNFQQIFQSINNSELSEQLQITHCINKEIAEYATGQFVVCNGTNCTNQIPILKQDEQIYNNNHNNCTKLGYKWDINCTKYFCSNCMDFAKACGCNHNCCKKLNYPNNSKCHLCSRDLCFCDCGCDWCSIKIWDKCNHKTCWRCSRFRPGVTCEKCYLEESDRLVASLGKCIKTIQKKQKNLKQIIHNYTCQQKKNG